MSERHLAASNGAGRSRGVLLVGGAGAAILAALWGAGALSWLPALMSLAALAGATAAAAALEPRRPSAAPRRADTQAAGGLPGPVLESVIELMPEPLMLLDSRASVVTANAAARRLFGAALAGKPLAAILRNPKLLDAVEAAMAGHAAEEVAFTLPVPIERHIQAVLSPLRLQETPPPEAGRAGAPSILLLFRDVTAVRRLEQMRVDFVANVSHELRTPLAVLSGFIETLRGPARDDPEARDRFLGIMEDQAGRMARLIGNLLSLSRIEMDEHRAPTGRVDLAVLAREVAAALQPVADAKGIALRVALPEGSADVVGDRDQLFQVLQNLIDNAIKYGGSGGAVAVEPGEAAGLGRVAVAVRDWGAGIPREHLPRLTERFYRVDVGRSRDQGGTGLGLAIVKHILNRHSGRLSIESTPGQGSTFTVTLPAAPERAAGDAAAG